MNGFTSEDGDRKGNQYQGPQKVDTALVKQKGMAPSGDKCFTLEYLGNFTSEDQTFVQSFQYFNGHQSEQLIGGEIEERGEE